MELVRNSGADEPAGREMTVLERWAYRVKLWFYINVSRHLPRLVWIDDEIDVVVTFAEDPINTDKPEAGLLSGGIYEIQQQLRQLGITFDHGQGFSGRDWEWDWSLAGPISVRFKSRARRPERRTGPRSCRLRVIS